MNCLWKPSLKLLCAAMCLAALLGCAASQKSLVQAGDTAQVDFTCRLSNGRVVLTTKQDVAEDTKNLAAKVFLPLKTYGPMELIADPAAVPKAGELTGLELGVDQGLQRAIVGLPVGKERTVTLKGEVPEGLKKEDRYITVGRIARHKKEQRWDLQRLARELGHTPAPGEQVLKMPGITAVMTGVDGREALVRIAVTHGQAVDHTYGRAIIRDYPDHYDVVTEAKVGQIVRTLDLVGRIIAVTDTTLTLDYGDPFGGEELTCDVCVRGIGPSAAGRAAAGGQAKP